MSKLVHIDGGPTVGFPDDATDAQISEVLARDYPAKQPDVFANSQPTVITSDDNLARAAQDFQGLQSVGMNLSIRPSGQADVVLGRAFDKAGKAVYGAVADAGDLVFGEAAANLYPPAGSPPPTGRDAGEPPTNLAALSRGEPLPAETQLRSLPGSLRVPAEAARGLIESTPRLAAVAGLEAAGVPAPIGAAAVFGQTPEGFSPKQAAIAAALPFVGRYGGEIAGALSRRMGVSSTQAQNIIKALGGSTAAATAMGALDLAQISRLPKDQQKDAMVEAVANAFSQMALGPLGVKYSEPTMGEVVGEDLQRSVDLIDRTVPESYTLGQADDAARVRVPGIVEQGQPSLPPGGVMDAPAALAAIEAKPPVQPKPELSRRPTGRPGERLPDAEVPEGPDEERLTAVEEIRRADARTIRQIQDLFPKAQLTREQARSWRELAFPKGETTEAGSPTNEPEAPTSEPEAPSNQPQENVAVKNLDYGKRRVERRAGDKYDFDNPDDLSFNLIPSKDKITLSKARALNPDIKVGENIIQRVMKDGTLDVAEVTEDQAAPASKARGVQRFEDEWHPKADNRFSTQVGLELRHARDLTAMLEHRKNSSAAADRWRAVAEKAMKEGDQARFGEAMNASLENGHRAQLAREAIEVATNSGSWAEGSLVKLGKRPLDNAAGRAWLEKNAEAAGIAMPEPEEPTRPAGAPFTASTPVEGVKVKGNYDVVDAHSLFTSEDPGFDPTLQPRDRKRVASQQQVANLVRNFEAQRLGHSPTSDTGAPVVDEGNQVLSGNGRTMALRQKYLTGRGGDYKDWLVTNAADFGLDPDQVAAMDNPVLVRRVSDYGKISKAEFARQSNQQQVSGMSEAEKASADARMLAGNPELLASFRPGESGEVLAASNREFLNAFVKGTGDQNELLSKEGYNGPVLSKRVRNAVLGALIGPENRTLLNQLLEEADTLGVKNAVNGIMASAPQLMRFKGTPYDLSGLAAQALKDLVGIRTRGEKLDDFLGSKELFADPARTAESDAFLTLLNQAKSAKALTDGLNRYIAGAKEALQDLQSGGMLGTQPATRAELIERANAKPTSQAQADNALRESQLALGQPGQDEPAGSAAAVQPGQSSRTAPQESEALEPEASFGLDSAQSARQAADAGIRGSTQQRNPPLNQAAAAFQASAPKASPAGPASQGIARGLFTGFKRIFAAGTVDEEARVMAGIMRHVLGKEYEWGRQADFALRTFRQEFDRTPVARGWKFQAGIPLPRNYEVMRAIDTGDFKGLTPIEAQFAANMRRLFDQAIDMVHQVSPDSMRTLIKNYFPRLWKDPVGNADKINALLSKRPWEGPKSFMKKRVLQYFEDGLAMGLVPMSDNPVDVTLAKLGEMYRFVATRQAMEEAKDRGVRKFVYIYEKPPGDNWRDVPDRSSEVFAPPVTTVREAFDAQVRAKTLEMLDALGVKHTRKVDIGGARRWGYSKTGQSDIVTKIGGPDAIIWHEFGHAMDDRYPDLRDRFPMTGSSTMAKELQDLADLRFAGQQVSAGYKGYVRKAEEKMANLFDAYIRAPKLFQRTAPNVWAEFNEFLSEHPELKGPLDDVAGTFDTGSLTLGTNEAEKFLGGPVLLGRWMMPEGAAQVVDNYLSPGLGRYAWFRGLREISGLVNGLQLAGFFHGGFVLNDSFYSGIGLALYDGMQGKLGRAAKEVVQIPFSPFTSFLRGGKIRSAIEDPASANATNKLIGQLAVEANLRAGHGNFDPEFSRRWGRAFRELMAEPSPGAAWETLWRAPAAAVNTVMKPVMDHLVPRMKMGIFARMAERVIADNPGADIVTLRKLLGKAADATEDRLGQVTYDNLFQSRVVKDAMQLAMRAYGWQLTKYRMMVGGVADWARVGRDLAAGKKPEVTFRMTYLPAMAIGHAILGGTLHYALTGKRPQKLVDLLFPESGLVDAYGQKVRLNIADFVKDFVADFKSFPNASKMVGDFTRKLAPFWNMAAEMYKNQDFWGTEIFSRRSLGEPELDHVMRNVWEGIQYMAKGVIPFSARGSNRLKEAGAGKLLLAGPFVGITPAPSYATMTPAQTRALEITRANLPKAPTTKEQAARAQAEAQIVRDIRTGKLNSDGEFAARAKAAGINVDARELTKLRERVNWTPLQYQVNKMSVRQAMEEVFDLANEQERVSIAPFLAQKINNAYQHGKLSPVDTRRYVDLVMPYYRRRSAPAKQAAAPAPAPYSAFNPQR